jgi:RimJ/RimL family protein N-acetyltransferase
VRHELALGGATFGLRPVTLADAAFIVELRTDSRLARFIGGTSPRVEDQERWLEAYFARTGDYYFVVHAVATGRAEGTIAIYDVDQSTRCAEWGRWVLRPGSLAAPESALLLYRVAFDTLGLEMVYCRTVAANEQVVSFHTSCGLTTHARLADYVTLGGVTYDAIEQRMTRAAWATCETTLVKAAAAVTRLARPLTGL